jgi:hypothetical protein
MHHTHERVDTEALNITVTNRTDFNRTKKFWHGKKLSYLTEQCFIPTDPIY